MTKRNWIRNSLTVARTGPEELHVLTTVYPEFDALNAGGQLLCHGAGDEENTRSVLSTSRPLAAMWRSSRKRLWLASSDGHVWTTADTPWDDPEEGNETSIASPKNWTSTALPELEGTGRPPNITAIWGASDANVFFTTSSGAIYRWDGRNWSAEFELGGESFTKIHGTAFDNVYAAGYGATIAYWNGENWKRIVAPDLDADTTIITGIAVRKSGEAFAVTNRGQLLTRAGDIFQIVAEEDVWFSGLVAWKGVLAASSSQGAWLYSPSAGLRKVKSNFAATDIMVVQNELYFIESDQPDGPAVIEYVAKREEAAWQRLVF